MKKIAGAFVAAAGMIWMAVPTFVQSNPKLTLQASHGGKAIPDHYIVVLSDGVDPSVVANRYGTSPSHVYTSALNGFAAPLSRGQLQQLLRDDDVEYVDEDGVVQMVHDVPDLQDLTGTLVQPGAPWNLDRLDQNWGSGLDGNYNYTDRGAGVNVYVVDTGIHVTHNEFDGAAANRAKAGASGFDALGGNGLDCNGHGTHVSGTIGGTTYGVAKAVKLYSVRVLDCGGSGTWANFIAAAEWITSNHIKPAVALAPLGGPFTQSVNDAVTKSTSWGVTWVTVAGASNSDACNFSPASTPVAITVGAVDMNNARASFSNFGPCVDLFAPGINVTSAWYTNDSATLTISGSASASAHVAGLAALYLNANKAAAPGQVTDAIEDSAVQGVITGLPGGTPNLLAHKINGVLAGTGSQLQEPDVVNGQLYYWSSNAGYHHVWVRGSPATHDNIEFYRWNGSSWVKVAQKATASTSEYLKYYGLGGYYYMYLVISAAGAGTYDSWSIRPD